MRVVLILLLLAALLPGMAAPWVGYRAPGVVLFVHPRQETLARRVGAMAEGNLPRLCAALGVARAGPFRIFVYTSDVEFMRATTPDVFLMGVSYQPTGDIRLVAGHDDDQLQTTLAHELTHSLLNQRLGNNIGALPTWVNEGMAGHLSDPVDPRALAGIAKMIHRNGVLSLPELETGFDHDETRAAAYFQSRSMMAWLEVNHPGALRKLIDRLAAGDAFEDALHTAAGLTPERWWKQWQAGIPPIEYWLSFLNSPVLYAPLALLAIIAVLIRALRRREESEETPEEEANAPTPADADADEPDPVEERHLPETAEPPRLQERGAPDPEES